MELDYLKSLLLSMENPKRENRERVANIVYEHPQLCSHLIQLVFQTEDKISIKAAWILEWICNRDIRLIIPYLDIFTAKIGLVHFDSAVRPMAKICELLAMAYASRKELEIKNTLTQNHIDLIIETAFDWLITPQKIAVRAYSMNTLYLFGKDKKWIYPELSHIISNKIIHQSKGCEARGKKILALIKKHHF